MKVVPLNGNIKRKITGWIARIAKWLFICQFAAKLFENTRPHLPQSANVNEPIFCPLPKSANVREQILRFGQNLFAGSNFSYQKTCHYVPSCGMGQEVVKSAHIFADFGKGWRFFPAAFNPEQRLLFLESLTRFLVFFLSNLFQRFFGFAPLICPVQ